MRFLMSELALNGDDIFTWQFSIGNIQQTINTRTNKITFCYNGCFPCLLLRVPLNTMLLTVWPLHSATSLGTPDVPLFGVAHWHAMPNAWWRTGTQGPRSRCLKYYSTGDKPPLYLYVQKSKWSMINHFHTHKAHVLQEGYTCNLYFL